MPVCLSFLKLDAWLRRRSYSYIALALINRCLGYLTPIPGPGVGDVGMDLANSREQLKDNSILDALKKKTIKAFEGNIKAFIPFVP